MAEPDTTIWCCFMNNKKQFMGELFFVEGSLNLYVAQLKETIKAKTPDQTANVDANQLVMWKWPGVLDVVPTGKLDDRVGDFEQSGVRLEPQKRLNGLQWSESDLLVVQIPGHVAPADNLDHDRFRPLSEVPEKYWKMIIKATSKGLFQLGDLRLNNLRESTSDDVPFVKCFKQKLGRFRIVDREALPACEDDNLSTSNSSAMKTIRDVREKLMKVLCFKSTEESTDVNEEENMDVSYEEITHLTNLALFDSFGDAHKPRASNEDMANATLFFPLRSLLDRFLNDDITYKFGNTPWPLQLWVQIPGEAETQVNKRLFSYRPKSDFVVLKGNVPRLVVEVESHENVITHEDRNRMLAQSGSIIRFANTHLDRYQKEKDFVLVAIYIDESGVAEWLVLYQDKGSDAVHWTSDKFSLTEVVGRLEFARRLYNLVSDLAKEPKGNAEEKIEELNQAVQESVKNFGLARFKLGESGGGVADQLEVYGYEVVPDAFEDARGCLWESVHKLPPNLLTVYRASDVKKTELIAKKVRKRSNANRGELQILQYLHTNRSLSPHVIEFIDSIVTTEDTWIILPKLYAIADQLEFNDGRSLHGKVEQFSWGLIKGLAYLHESGIAHLDIKPDNLVYDNSYQLKIIDFDVAVRVKDEDEEIEGYRGTEGWTAPEVGEEDGPTPRYSPIKADRWSCGRVLLSFLKIEGRNRVLPTVADQLMSSDPHMRPSLLGWHKWYEAEQLKLNGTNMKDLDDGVARRVRKGVTDEDDVQSPVAKKPKLVLPDGCSTMMRHEQQVLPSLPPMAKV